MVMKPAKMQLESLDFVILILEDTDFWNIHKKHRLILSNILHTQNYSMKSTCNSPNGKIHNQNDYILNPNGTNITSTNLQPEYTLDQLLTVTMTKYYAILY